MRRILCTIILSLSLVTSAIAGVELVVGSGEKYSSIQAAIDAIPQTLDQPYVVKVKSGHYAPFKISGKKTSSENTLKVVGESVSEVIIEIPNGEDGVSVGEHPSIQIRDQNFVTLENLAVKGGTSYGSIILLRAKSNKIIHCAITGNMKFDGISMTASSDNTLEHNTIYGNKRAGIYLIFACKNNTVRFNIFAENLVGLWLDESKGPNAPTNFKWNGFFKNSRSSTKDIELGSDNIESDAKFTSADHLSMDATSPFFRWGATGEASESNPLGSR